MRNTLIDSFGHIYPKLIACPVLLDELSNACKRQVLKRGQMLIKAGEVNDTLYYIKEGLLRGYYYTDTDTDTAITSWFKGEGGFVAIPHSFFGQQESGEYVEAIEKTIVFSLKHHDLERISVAHPIVHSVRVDVARRLLIEFDHGQRALRLPSVEQRLAFFEEHHKAIYPRLPLKYVASFLNMTPQTLSKTRGKKR